MLQEADYGLTDAAMTGNAGRYKDDDKLFVRFFIHARIDNIKSAEEKRPIYKDVDYIQIMQPGNKDSIIMRPATDMDKVRFVEHFRKYELRTGEQHMEGTPLTDWPGIRRSQAEELKFFHCHTVEQLAGLSDSNAQNIMGIHMLKQKAQEYLLSADKNATNEKLSAAEEQIAELKEQMAILMANQGTADNAKDPELSDAEKE